MCQKATLRYQNAQKNKDMKKLFLWSKKRSYCKELNNSA